MNHKYVKNELGKNHMKIHYFKESHESKCFFNHVKINNMWKQMNEKSHVKVNE